MLQRDVKDSLNSYYRSCNGGDDFYGQMPAFIFRSFGLVSVYTEFSTPDIKGLGGLWKSHSLQHDELREYDRGLSIT